MTKTETVNILWTGGWDSTFRILQLAREGRVVQPYYIIDTGRPSTLIEIQRMQEIRQDTSLKYPQCVIKEIVFIELSTIAVEQKYKDAYDRLLTQSFMGTQYIWIAQLAHEIDGLELCVHRDDKAEYFITQITVSPNEESDAKLIFGYLEFPILEYTKPAMEQEARANDEFDILNKSWFCYTPVNNGPCGVCNPCKYSLEEGMEWRFSKRGRLYSKMPNLIKRIRRFAKRFV